MNKIHLKILKFYWQEAKKHPWPLAAIFLGQVGGITADLIPPYLYKLIIDLVTAGSQDFEQIFFYLVLILIVGLTLGNLWRFAGFGIIKLQTAAIKNISDYCFNYIQKHSYNFFSSTFTGGLLKQIGRFVGAFEGITNQFTWGLNTLAIRTVFVTILLLITDWRIATALVVWLIIFLIGLRLYLNFHVKYDSAVAENETRVTAQLADAITNFENVKLFNSTSYEERRFGNITHERYKKQSKSWNLNEYFFGAQTIFMVIGEFVIMYITLRLWQADTLTIGTVILVQAYIAQIMMRLWDLSHVFKDIYSSLANAEEMMRILDEPHEITDEPNATTIKIEQGEIEFHDVTYNYEGVQSVFTNLNIKIAPKEKVALVGESGAGKSTFVKLLLRFYDLDNGSIKIDDQDITKHTKGSLREQIAFVPQTPIMFHRSIMENIRYGRLDATDEEVIEAAKMARCHNFILRSGKGYDTFVGERGIKLSGGERQRIAIARAILKNAPILVLDEATSSLDSRSERLIQAALHELMKDKTVIAIAHRLSTVREMDRIIVLENGAVLEEGKHDQLIEKDEHYAELWRLQSAETVVTPGGADKHENQ